MIRILYHLQHLFSDLNDLFCYHFVPATNKASLILDKKMQNDLLLVVRKKNKIRGQFLKMKKGLNY